MKPLDRSRPIAISSGIADRVEKKNSSHKMIGKERSIELPDRIQGRGCEHDKDGETRYGK